MGKIIYIIICFSFLFCDSFLIDQDFGQINIDSISYDKPFLGGFNKPKVQWLDWDHDGDDDLFLLDEDGRIKYYNNQLFDENAEFVLVSTNYFDFNPISWFYIEDFDQDLEYEIIIQDYNNINQMIYYDIIDSNLILLGTVYNNLLEPVVSDPVMTPTFIDIDNDGDLDFFTGNMIGTITYYENIGFNNSSFTPEFELITIFWEDIYIVGPSNRHGASAIKFIDIDNDLDYDLSWGDYFQQSLYIIKNEGTVDTPDMDNINVITYYPQNSPVITAGLNMPSFTDIDGDLDMDLFVTVLSGAYGYQLIDNFIYFQNNGGEYSLITNEFIKTLDLFSDIYPELVDIDSDGDLDLFIGTDVDFSSLPWFGKIKFFENISTVNDEPVWSLSESEYLGGEVGNNLSLDFGDIDNDDDFDLVIGDFNGRVKLYVNTGSQYSSNFIFDNNIQNIDLSGYSVPKLVDIDNDNDLDLFVGEMSGSIFFYENIGTPILYDFVLVSDNFQNIDIGSRASIDFIDIDFDDDLDLFVGSQNNGIVIFKNIGSVESPEFIIDDNIDIPFLGLNTAPALYYDNDKINLISGLSTGGAYYLSYDSCGLSGDFNQNSVVDIVDIIFLVNIILGDSLSESTCPYDINNDFNVDVIDIMLLVDIILSL